MQSVQAIEPKDRAERLAVLRKLINYEIKHAPDYYRAWLDTQSAGQSKVLSVSAFVLARCRPGCSQTALVAERRVTNCRRA